MKYKEAVLARKKPAKEPKLGAFTNKNRVPSQASGFFNNTRIDPSDATKNVWSGLSAKMTSTIQGAKSQR